ncbi:MAG: hypothetical protein GYA48_16895 [Chloroflexi bacterium]|nr:hypothetical protein [Chloroflexota bacterium]
MIALAFALVLFAALWLVSLLPLRGLVSQILAVYLLCFTNIALSLHIANLLGVMNQPIILLGLHALFFVLVLAFWVKKGRPDPFSPGRRILWWARQILLQKFTLQNAFLPSLALIAGLVYLFNAFLNMYVPPNTVDSLSTHLSRVGFWLQRGSFFPWSTPRIWQITYPVNAQLQMFWSVLFTRSDRLVGFTQWFAALAAALAVVGLARLNKATISQAIFAGLVFLSLPAIVLQSTTTQNDLVICALFITAIYFFFLALQDKHPSSVLLSGLALGLGVGTKQTIFFLLPTLALVALLAWLVFKQIPFKRLLVWAAAALAAFGLIGSQIFISNQIHFGNPLGSKAAVEQSTGILRSEGLIESSLINGSRLLYQMADLAGLPDPLWGYGIKAKAALLKPVFSVLNIDVESEKSAYPGHHFELRRRYLLQEDEAWYGPLGFLLLVPWLLVEFIRGLRQKDLYRISAFLFFASFLIFDILFRPGWDPYQGRYFMPAAALAAPLAADWLGHKRASAWAGWLACTVAVSTLISCVLLNPAKPLEGHRSIWRLDRGGMMTLQNYYFIDTLKMVEKKVPSDATLGIASQKDYYPDYVFFGPRFERTLIPVHPPEKISDRGWVEEQQVEYMLVYLSDTYPPQDADYLEKIAETDLWGLFVVK